MNNQHPLSMLRVVELAQGVAAAYCGRQFAAWGSDVVVVEPPNGSALRRLQPLIRLPDGRELSALWMNVAANKRAISSANLDRDGLLQLLGGADVLIAGHDLELSDFGLTLKQIHRRFPGLGIVSISPFGSDGPYAGFAGSALVAEALSGYLSLNGVPDAPPLRAPHHLIDYVVGVNAFVGALAAYLKRLRHGSGDIVEVSTIETLASVIPFLRVQYISTEKRREGGTEAGVRILPCADGWISMMAASPLQKDTLAEVLGIAPATFPEDLYAGSYHDIVRKTVEFLSSYTITRRADELFHALEAKGVTCGKVMSIRELLSCPQLQARRFFRSMAHPELGELECAGPPGRLRFADQVRPAPPPNRPVSLEALRWEARPLQRAETAGGRKLPLGGLRVLDLTQAWIGPFATLIFADLGAEVIKIESHRRPDVWRQASPQPTAITNVKAERVNRSHYFNSVNRNKVNLALDLRAPEGKDIFLKLLAGADIVAENYTPRVMERFGLHYEALREVKSDVVMMSSSGFGKDGPWSDYKSNGSAIEALAGWDDLHRYHGGPPILMGFYQADPISGFQMAAMTLISLIRRTVTGDGECIDGSMLEASAGYLGELFLYAQLGGEPAALGNRSLDMAPHGVYPCRGDDRWIAIAVPGDSAWAALVGIAGAASGLADEPFATREGRLLNQDTLDARLADWTRSHDAEALMHTLQSARVPAGVVRSAAEALEDPHLEARRWFKPLAHPDLGTHKYNGFPWRFMECELQPGGPPPRLGEHSEALLKTLLSLTDEQIAVLKTKGVTGAVL